MTTLYRFGILACLITIAYAVWKLAHSERVTSVAPDMPQYTSDWKSRFSNQEETFDYLAEKQRNSRLSRKDS